MLMGRWPGNSPAAMNMNGYVGAQRFTGAPLQPYPMPQPVPRPPVAPPPAPPAAPSPLPSVIEAWRAQLLAMNPLLLSRQFGMPAAQIVQLLADPQTAALLYQQAQKQNNSFVRPFGGGEGGNSDVAGQSAADSLRSGMADLTLGNVASALNFGSRILSMEGLLGLGLQGLGHLAFPGWIDSPLPEFTGQIDVNDIVAKNPEIAAAIKDLKLDPNPLRARHKLATVRGMIQEAALREATTINKAKEYGRQAVAAGDATPTGIANSGGLGRPGTPGAPRSTGSTRSGGGSGGQGKSSGPGAGPGGRGPKGGGAYGGMGGVGSHGV